MKFLKWLLQKLNGKKATLVALIMTTTAFLALKLVIDMDTQVYIDSVVLILAGTANIANARMK